MNPDGSTVVTGAGDETLRFWNIFPGPSKPSDKIEHKILEGLSLRWWIVIWNDNKCIRWMLLHTIYYRQSKIKIKLMLLALSMARNRCVEDWPYPLAFVLPTRVNGLRHFSHEGSVHQAQSFLTTYINWLEPVIEWVTSFALRLSWVSTCDVLGRSSCPEPSCHGLPELLSRFYLIRQYFFRLFNRSFGSLRLIVKNYLMDPLFLLNRLRFIDKR